MLAVQVRSDLIETFHDGAAAVVSAGGDLMAAAGDIDRPFFWRSGAKPFQAAVALSCGAALTAEELAVACASHDGEPVHVALVERILTGAGLDEANLGCPPDWPIRAGAARRLVAGGAAAPRRLWHNCSGKHAAMLAAAAASGWDLEGYLDPTHPLQRRITAYLEALAGPVTPIGVDGCGAPVFATTARRMAGAFAALSSAPDLAVVFGAMHSYPALVSGTRNCDAAIAVNLDAAAKRGAAGVLGVAMRGRCGIAVKSWDGSSLVAGMTAIAILDRLGALTPLARERLQSHARPAVYGGGRPVGSFESLMELRWQ